MNENMLENRRVALRTADPLMSPWWGGDVLMTSLLKSLLFPCLIVKLKDGRRDNEMQTNVWCYISM